MKSEMKLTRSSTTTSLDEYELMSDPKYRTYVQQIDKALKGFEYTSEWADLVNALGKLNKVKGLTKLTNSLIQLLIFSGASKQQQIQCHSKKVYRWSTFGSMHASCFTIRSSFESIGNIRSHL